MQAAIRITLAFCGDKQNSAEAKAVSPDKSAIRLQWSANWFLLSRHFLINYSLILLSCSPTKEFGLAKEEFCRLKKELYSAGKKLYSLAKESNRVAKEFE